jgi:hypothetical protein
VFRRRGAICFKEWNPIPVTHRARIIDAFLTRWSATPELLFGSNSPSFWGYPRQVAMYLFHDVCNDTFEEIARMFAGETPGTVMLKVTQIEMERGTDPRTEHMLQAYYELIEQPHGTHKRPRSEQPSLDGDGEGFHRL